MALSVATHSLITLQHVRQIFPWLEKIFPAMGIFMVMTNGQRLIGKYHIAIHFATRISLNISKSCKMEF